jgi:chemotaxis protein MotA
VDPTTLVGLLLGWGALVGAMLLDHMSPTAFFNLPGLVLVVGGTAGATIASFMRAQSAAAVSILKQTFAPQADMGATIGRMVELAGIATRQGILALDKLLEDVEDPFVRRALQLVIDGTPTEDVRRVLEEEYALVEERHRAGERMFSTAAGFAPTLGIIGTVVGLINMLRTLSNPSGIGPAIATAFLATLYGVSLANLFLLPVANKLRARHEHEMLVKRIVVQGAVGIASKTLPRLLREQLVTYLPPAERKAVLEALARSAPEAGREPTEATAS